MMLASGSSYTNCPVGFIQLLFGKTLFFHHHIYGLTG